MLNKIFNHVSDDFCFYIRRSNGLNRLAFVSFSSLVLLLAVLLNPPMPEFERANALTGVAVAADTSISITSTDASASIDLTNKISSAGSFMASADEESINFSLNTNNYTGYTLSIVANDDEGSLTTSDNSGSLASVSSITAASDFSNNRNYNGKWGLKPSKYVTDEGDIITNNSEDPVYLPSPTTTPTVLDKTTAANESNMSNDYAIALGARVDWSVQPGAYSRTFSLVALANPAPYSIVYDKNTNDNVANLPAAQVSDSMTETNISLSNSIPTREHYSFLGWCSVATTNSNGVDSCSGTIYNPNGDGTNLTYGIDQTTTNNTRLYAMWEMIVFACNKQYRLENADGSWGEYQTETPETIIQGGTCNYSKQINNYKSQNGANDLAVSTSVSNMSEDVTLSLDLYRNNYTVSLTKGTGVYSVAVTGSGVKSGYGTDTAIIRHDGEVIITASMNSGYDWVNWTGSATYTGQSQVVSNTTGNLAFTANGVKSCIRSISGTMQAFDPSGLCSNVTSGTLTDSRDSKSYTVAKIDGKWWMTKNLDLSGNRVLTPSTSNVTSNYTLPPSKISSPGFGESGSVAHVYNSNSTTCGSGSPCYSYYSFTAATAGTVLASSAVTGDATQDICPKGWKLPSSNDFNSLVNSAGTKLASSAFKTVYSGYYAGTTLFDGGSAGTYWGTRYSYQSSNKMKLGWFLNSKDSSAVVNGMHRYHGRSIRCILKT